MPAQSPASSVEELVSRLRKRDADPSFSTAPVLDVYGRISQNPETGELEKVDRQLLDCLSDVERRQARLGEVLRDDGISAWSLNAKRPGWAKLVARLEDRKSHGVICWHTDRLMRQPRDLERLVDLGNRGVLVASCHGDYDLADADDRFTLRVLTAAAAKESDSTSRRQKRKAAAARAAGRRSGGPRAFGMPGKGVSGELVAAERDAIAWAVRAHLDGISLHAVAREWDQRGLRSARGNQWDARTVGQVLVSPRVAGLLAYQGVVVGRLADTEPIVTEEEWAAVKAKFASRRRGRPISEPYVLSGGHLRCGHCGEPLTGKAASDRPQPDGAPRRKYACRERGEGCGRITIGAEPVEAEVQALVVRTLSDPRHAGQLARRSAKLAAAQDRLAQAEETARELARRLGEGLLSLDRFDAASAPLDARIARLRQEVDALRQAGAGEEGRRLAADEVADLWENATVEEKRAMVRRVAPKGIVVLPATNPRSNQHRSDFAARLEVL